VAFGNQGALDHAAGATTDHPACVIVTYRRQAFAGQDQIEGRNQVGRGIDQRAVEIEDDGAHHCLLIPVFAGAQEQTALGSGFEAGYTACHER
jgi:hypothetical protein